MTSFFRRRVSQCPIIINDQSLSDFLLLTFYWHRFKVWYGLPMGKLSYNDKLRMQTLWQVSHCLV